MNFLSRIFSITSMEATVDVSSPIENEAKIMLFSYQLAADDLS